MSLDNERNFDAYRLGLIYNKEIHVQALVSNRVELKLVKNCGVLLVSENEINDESLRSVGDCLELLGINCEKNVLDTASLKVARNKTLLAESLESGFVADLTWLAFKFKMLHCKIN